MSKRRYAPVSVVLASASVALGCALGLAASWQHEVTSWRRAAGAGCIVVLMLSCIAACNICYRRGLREGRA